LQVLGGYSVIDTDNRPLKQTPEILHAHCMDVSVDEGLGVTDGFMFSAFGGFLVALEFVGDKQFSTDTDKSVEERGERIGFEVLDDLGCDVTASLLEPYDDLLAGRTTTTLSAGLLATDVSIIGFDDTAELVFEPIPWPHGLSYLHTDTPGGFVGDSQGSLKLFGADPLLVVTHKPDGGKPFLKGCSATMEDSAGSDGELIGTVAATPYLAGGNPIGLRGAATRTVNAIGPALRAKEDLALVLGGEPFLKLDDVHGSSFWNHYTSTEPVCQGDKAFAFYGDSLTEGIPGVSFFGALEAMLPEHELKNCGKGGDTIISLYRRIARSWLQDPVDIAVLWVGVNDVLAKVTFSHSMLKRLMGQPRARDLTEFRDYYHRTLKLLSNEVRSILAVSPLLIGEDLSNPWNRELGDLCKIVASVSNSFDNVHYLDLRADLSERLKGKHTSDYVAKSVTCIACDTLFLRTPAQVDAVASGRGLSLTLDGVHLNSTGVAVVSEAFLKAIRSLS